MQLSDKLSVIKSFKQPTRKWYGHALAGMILSDGAIDDNELVHLQDILVSLEPKEEAIKLVQAVKTKSLPELNNIDIHDKNVCVDILFSLIDIAVSDFRLVNSELNYLKSVCTKLGFDNLFSQKIVSFAQDYMDIYNKAREIKNYAKRNSVI